MTGSSLRISSRHSSSRIQRISSGIHSSRPAVLQAVAAAAPAAFANALAFGAFGFLAENFGKILVCTVLVTAEVKQGVTVSDYAFPIVFEQAF